MIVINFQDQLQAGTFEHAIYSLVENNLDLSVYFPDYKNQETGRPAYDPAILLKIILFAYSKGITSSREMNWNCQTNIIFKALSCDTVPHHTTLANFVSGHTQAIESIFAPQGVFSCFAIHLKQILLTCDEQGLLGHELFTIDGCKMSSDSAKEWSGTFKELRQKRKKIKRLIQYHIEEDKKFTKNEPLEEAQIKRAKQAVETLTKSFNKIDRFLKTETPRIGTSKKKDEVKSNITDNESAKMLTSKGTIQGYNGVNSVDKKHQIIIDAQTFGSGQEHHTLQPVLETIKERYKRLGFSRNIFEDDVVVTADTGFANEKNMKYLHDNNINAYIPDNKFRSRDPKFSKQKEKYGKRHQLNKKNKMTKGIPASEFTFDPVAKTCTCPEGKLMGFLQETRKKNENKKIFFEGRLTECRHCKSKVRCMRNPESASTRTGHGRQVSFILGKKKTSEFTDWMKPRVDSDAGKLIYSHRMSVVEPVFGNIGYNKKLNRFSLRTKKKVQCQWKLYCIVHNIEKLANYGQLAA